MLVGILLPLMAWCGGAAEPEAGWRIASFSADVTIPLGHRCMGVLPVKSRRVADPLFAHGMVLLGPEEPVVLCAVDWCEIRNGAYDQWRDTLARAAGTRRERVLVTALHQHDAPVVDADAARWLADAGLTHELYDAAFHDLALARVAQALKASLPRAQALTHLGMGQAPVAGVASNRRVVLPDGRVAFTRGSRSGADPLHRDAPEGELDPMLKTLSFWNGERALVALHAYATHPMSHYGNGEVSADFVGLARARRQSEDPAIHHIYVSGCSGDVTAGKYNDGSPAMRQRLADRVHEGMAEAWKTTRRVPLQTVGFRHAALVLPFSEKPELAEAALITALNNRSLAVEKRILAAMGLASRRRVASGQPIDVPCLDFGAAQLVLFPGETFVGYQLLAQAMRPGSFVVSVGYGECWPGYIPTESALREGFDDPWMWVGPGSAERLRSVLRRVLLPDAPPSP